MLAFIPISIGLTARWKQSPSKNMQIFHLFKWPFILNFYLNWLMNDIVNIQVNIKKESTNE